MSARCDLDLERQILGALTQGAGVVRAVRAAGLKPEHLTTTEHRELLEVVYSVADQDAPELGPDEHLIRAELQRRGSAVSAEKVSELAAEVDAPGNAGPQAARVVELAALRRAHDAGYAIGKAAEEGDWKGIRQHVENLPTSPGTAEGWESEDVGAVLDAVKRGESLVEKPNILPTDTGRCVFHEGTLASVAALGGTGKGWFAAAARSILESGGGVLYLDWEETLPRRVDRLVSVGTRDEPIRKGFRYARPQGPVGELSQLDALLPPNTRMVVVDSVEAAMSTEGFTTGDVNQNAQAFVNGWPKYLQKKGILILLIDHLPKRSENDDGPINGVAKFNQMDTQLVMKTIEPLGRGKRGKVSIRWGKDRLGFWGKGTCVDMNVVSTGKTVDVYIDERPTLEPSAGPTHRMEQVAQIVEQSPGISLREIREKAGGRATITDDARDQLIEGGYIEERQEGRKRAHYLLKTYPAEAESGGTHNGYVSGVRDTLEVPNVA